MKINWTVQERRERRIICVIIVAVILAIIGGLFIYDRSKIVTVEEFYVDPISILSIRMSRPFVDGDETKTIEASDAVKKKIINLLTTCTYKKNWMMGFSSQEGNGGPVMSLLDIEILNGDINNLDYFGGISISSYGGISMWRHYPNDKNFMCDIISGGMDGKKLFEEIEELLR